MALSRIWSAFIIIAISVAGSNVFSWRNPDLYLDGNRQSQLIPNNPLKLDGIIETCWIAVEICLKLDWHS